MVIKRVVWLMLCIGVLGVSLASLPTRSIKAYQPVYSSYAVSIHESMISTDALLREVDSKKVALELLDIRVDMKIDSSTSLLELTNYTAEEFDIMLSDTELAGYGQSFVNVETEAGVNGLFMIALTGQEQGFGSGSLAQKKNNLTSYAAFDTDVGNARAFESWDECLIVTAKMLARDYLAEDGRHHNGVTATAVNVKYASDKTWASKIVSIMKQMQKKLINTANVT